MIVDARNLDPDARYTLVDAESGRPFLPSDELIFYADDEEQVYREYLRDDSGYLYLVPGSPHELAWMEVRPARRFQIVAKDYERIHRGKA